MQREQLVKLARRLSKPLGFQNRASQFWRVGPELTVLFNFVRSQWSSDVYVNFGVLPSALMSVGTPPSEGYWMFQARPSSELFPLGGVFERLANGNDGKIPKAEIEAGIRALLNWLIEVPGDTVRLRDVAASGAIWLHSTLFLEDWLTGKPPKWPACWGDLPTRRGKRTASENAAHKVELKIRTQQLIEILANVAKPLGFSRNQSLFWKLGTDICACITIEPTLDKRGLDVALQLATTTDVTAKEPPTVYHHILQLPADGIRGSFRETLARVRVGDYDSLTPERIERDLQGLCRWVDKNMTTLGSASAAGLGEFSQSDISAAYERKRYLTTPMPTFDAPS